METVFRDKRLQVIGDSLLFKGDKQKLLSMEERIRIREKYEILSKRKSYTD